MRSKTAVFFENFIVIAILLVLVQTFLEDFALLIDWKWNVRRIMVFTGFAFDLIFTIEFLVRLFYALLDGKVKEYMTKRRGWVDLIASVPLLMLNSGPATLSIIAGGSFLGLGGMLNVLKVIKAIRIARILRLLRVLKVFKQIKYADSVMAQRHVAKVTSICISVFVFSLFLITIFAAPLGLPSIEQKYDEQHLNTAELIDASLKGSDLSLETIRTIDPSILLIRKSGETVYSAMNNRDFNALFGPGEYKYVQIGDLEVYFDMRELQKFQAKDNIVFFIIIIVLVIVFLVYYSPHFAITVSDPIHVMRRGFEEPSYNLEVRVPDRYSDDDVFKLSKLYNEVYLPMKDRTAVEEGKGMVDLQLDDFEDLFEEGI